MVKLIARAAGVAGLAALGAWLFAERGRLMRRSTWRVLREGGRERLNTRGFLHTYAYARFPKQYIGHALKHLLPAYRPEQRQSAADHYHGKVLPTELASSLIRVDRPIDIPDLEQIIPYPLARELVLSSPPEVAAFECPCRLRKPEHCEPTQVCMIVGQPFVDFMLEHHPRQTRRLTTEEAIGLLEAEHARGHIHAAYFKDAMFDRFYAICNCCACCCGAVEAMTRHGVPMITSSGYVAQVDPAKCAACGACEAACPFGAIRVDGGSHINWQACMGCGVCVGRCDCGAIALALDARKGVPLDVRQLVN